METNWQDLVIQVMIAAALGIGALILGILGFKHIIRFFSPKDPGDARQRFKDNALGVVLITLAIVLILAIVFLFMVEKITWEILPLSLLGLLCLFPAIPISILGAYWQDFIMNTTFGRLVPVPRGQYGQVQSYPISQSAPAATKITVPRTALILGASAGALTCLGAYFLLAVIGVAIPDEYLTFNLDFQGWDISAVGGVLLRLCLAGPLGLVIFFIIITVALAHKIQRIRDRQAIYDE